MGEIYARFVTNTIFGEVWSRLIDPKKDSGWEQTKAVKENTDINHLRFQLSHQRE